MKFEVIQHLTVSNTTESNKIREEQAEVRHTYKTTSGWIIFIPGTFDVARGCPTAPAVCDTARLPTDENPCDNDIDGGLALALPLEPFFISISCTISGRKSKTNSLEKKFQCAEVGIKKFHNWMALGNDIRLQNELMNLWATNLQVSQHERHPHMRQFEDLEVRADYYHPLRLHH